MVRGLTHLTSNHMHMLAYRTTEMDSLIHVALTTLISPWKVHSTPSHWNETKTMNTIWWPLELFQAIGRRVSSISLDKRTMLESQLHYWMSIFPAKKEAKTFLLLASFLSTWTRTGTVAESFPPSREVGYQFLAKQYRGKRAKGACKRKLSKKASIFAPWWSTSISLVWKNSIWAIKRTPCAREEMKQIPFFLFQHWP